MRRGSANESYSWVRHTIAIISNYTITPRRRHSECGTHRGSDDLDLLFQLPNEPKKDEGVTTAETESSDNRFGKNVSPLYYIALT